MGAATGGPALAQVSATPPAVAQSRTFHVDATVAGSYDSNISRTSAAVAAARGLTREEYLLRATVGADIAQPVGRHMLFLRGSVGHDWHRENPELDRSRADLSGGYSTRVGPCLPQLFSSYRAVQIDLGEVDVNTSRNLLETTAVGAAVTCAQAQGPVVALAVQRQDTKNSAMSREPSDFTSEFLNASIGYSRPSIGQVALTFGYISSEFPNRIIPGRPIGDGFFSNTYGASYTREFGSRLRVSLNAGQSVIKREFAAPGTPLKSKTTSYGGAVFYRFGQRIDLDFTASRGVLPSNRDGKLFDIATSEQARISYRLGSRFLLSAGHGIDEIDSNPDTTGLAPGRPVLTNSRRNTTFGSVRFRQSRLLSLTADVRHERRKTNAPDFNYTATRVGVSATIGF